MELIQPLAVCLVQSPLAWCRIGPRVLLLSPGMRQMVSPHISPQVCYQPCAPLACFSPVPREQSLRWRAGQGNGAGSSWKFFSGLTLAEMQGGTDSKRLVVLPRLRVKPEHYVSPSASLSLCSGDVVIKASLCSVHLKSFDARENDGKSMSQWPWSCDVYQVMILKRKCKFPRPHKQFTTFHRTLAVHSRSPLVCQEPPLSNSAP